MELDLNKKHCYYFNEISKIPHGSRNEKRISDYLVDFAKKRSLKYVQDAAYNVVIYKEGSKGFENSEPLLLQGHMDMVCEANRDTQIDFENDPITLKTDGDWLMANGTTLGADDGVAVAYMLAVLDSDDVKHPPLECCFTVSEEIGLQGALKLDGSLFKAKRMLCMDTSGETVTTVSTAGGARAVTTIKGQLIDNSKNTYSLFISGLKGGHSGGFIDSGRTNSIIVANRIVKEMSSQGIDINLVNLNGGLKENAIPRECEYIFSSCEEFELINTKIKESFEAIKNEYSVADPGMNCDVKRIDTATKMFDKKSTNDILNFIYLVPNGFKEKSLEIEGLTLTSLNLGILKTDNDKVVLTDCVRSAIDSAKDNLINQIKAIAELCNGTVELQAPYPGWNYSKDCEIRDLLGKAVKEVTGKEMEMHATHGGNECGVFSSFGIKQIASCGPIMEDIHTPKERLNMKSFDACYEILLKVMEWCV